MTTYTKGPWTLTQEHTPDDPYGHYYYRLYAGNGYVGGKDENEGFEIAAIIHPTNAHLIAAAPEMYEALKTLLSYPNDGQAQWYANKALAKAEGRKV